MHVLEDPNFLRQTREHFVGISGKCLRLDGNGEPTGTEQNFAFSAFVIEIDGRWCLVTAGHVIQNLNDVVNHPRMRLLRCGLADYFNLEAKIKEPTPFAFRDERPIHIDQGGVDIGLIPLRDYYRISLRANGAIPTPIAHWIGRSPPDCEHYVLLGTPAEQTEAIERTEMRGSGLRVLLALVPLQPQSVPAEKQLSPIPRFAASLLDGGDLDSPEGMSGGPIIGLRKDERGVWTYACVAVQGSWDPKTRMVFGTPVSIIVEAILRVMVNQSQ